MVIIETKDTSNINKHINKYINENESKMDFIQQIKNDNQKMRNILTQLKKIRQNEEQFLSSLDGYSRLTSTQSMMSMGTPNSQLSDSSLTDVFRTPTSEREV